MRLWKSSTIPCPNSIPAMPEGTMSPYIGLGAGIHVVLTVFLA